MYKISNFSFFIIMLLSSAISAQNVVHNIEDAKSQATSAQKHILMVFSGSDWCKPCIQLNRDILLNPDFQSFKSDHLVHLELDFPYRMNNQLSKAQITHNENLAEKYNSEGHFPKVLLMDENENIKSIINYKKGMSTKEFITQIQDVIL